MNAAIENGRPELDLQPHLQGPTLTLRPLLESDFEALYQAASDPLIWEQHPQSTRYQRKVFEGFFASALESKGALLVSDARTGEVLGSSRYYESDPQHRSIAIGFTFLIRSHWGGASNRELKHLMLRHVFAWVDTVWFHIGKDNWRSRKAMEKLGGHLSHEGDYSFNGNTAAYAFYRIDREGRFRLPALTEQA
jgi:RimJ/RimL family protein N-acetyltransferase